MIKTKIVCTIGPAVDNPDVMRSLIASGMDVARMNFSHGTHEEHLERLTAMRKIAGELGVDIPVLLDTKGPEIRLGEMKEGTVELLEGQQFVLTTEDIVGDTARATVSYKQLPCDLQPGNRVLIDDGLVELEVRTITETEITTIVQNGGVISSRKSINVPNVALNLPSMTEQDKKDILFAIENDYDFIAVSFVRKREDISVIERFLEENGGEDIKLIAKIESREGVNNLDDIIRVSDGIMVARGDLGVEIPVEEIPVVQKDMIERCYKAGKPVITATQMLDSMIRNPRPTRAEVTDVANAIFDGTSAIMLSGETASGKYPVEALQTMKRIALTTEDAIDYWQRFSIAKAHENITTITNAIGHATCTTAMDLNAAVIVAVTTSGETARRISSYRPQCPIVAATTSIKMLRQLRLSWGVVPVFCDVVESTDNLFETAVEAAKKSGIAGDGDIVVITSGVPLGVSGTTNMLRVQMVGNVLVRGKGVGTKCATGMIHIVERGEELSISPGRGEILVVGEISDEILPLIRLSSGLVLCGSDREGKAETLEKTLEIPVIVNAEGAMSILKSGTMVSIDARQGIVQNIE